MFGIDDLVSQIETQGEMLCCPVRGCSTRVPMQKKTFVAAKESLCPVHRIYVGKTTFEYEIEDANFLWTEAADRERLVTARKCKRESRMNRERSEDALTWNVFRHLEASGRLGAWASSVTGECEMGTKVHYWSCDEATGTTWLPLAEARNAFGELDRHTSEPDLVITSDNADIWVEAKFGSTNSTSPSDPDGAKRRYTEGGSNWYSQVVKSNFDEIAVTRRRYELLRLWLLGSWAAERGGKRFELVNLAREGFELDVPRFATDHLQLTPERRVHRATWESLHYFIAGAHNRTANDDTLLRYLRTKTLGYNSAGRPVGSGVRSTLTIGGGKLVCGMGFEIGVQANGERGQSESAGGR